MAIVDSFEDGDLSEYTGNTGAFNVVDEANVAPAAADGSMLLEAPAGTGDVHIYSVTGLDNYFAKGNVAHLWFEFDAEDDQTFFRWGVQDTNDYYQCFVEQSGASDFIRLQSLNGGTATNIDVIFGFGWTANTTYRIEITWDDGTLGGADNDITVDIYDADAGTLQGTLTGNNADHAAQTGISFGRDNSGNNTATYWYDYFHVTPTAKDVVATGAGTLTGSATADITNYVSASGVGRLIGTASAGLTKATIAASGVGTGTGSATLTERQKKFVIGALDNEDENDIFMGSNI